MINFGTVRPGITLYIPIQTFDSNDPSASVVASALIAADIEVYKDGSTTQRASDSGYTVTVAFDTIVGVHEVKIDLADNTTAGFWAAGSRYVVVAGPFTVDAATINAVIATFDIGYPDAILNTTIATLASATSFTLTKGPAEASALVGFTCLTHDVASEVQIAIGYVSAYAVTTKTVTLVADPGIFTAVATDNVSFFRPTHVYAVGGTAQTAGDVTALVVTADAAIDTLTTTVGTAGVGLTNVKLPEDGLDLILKTSTHSLAVADAVWDEVQTGATHNVTNSAGRRLRTLQTGGNYEGGMVWVDTVAGVAGTVTDENGVVTNPVDTLADARTLATAIPLKALHIANGSTVTLASATTNFIVEGHEWILALGGQDISGSDFNGANAVTGTSSGTTDVQFEDCVIGNGVTGATLPPGTYIRCGFNTGSGFAFTGSAAGRYVFVDCYSNIAVGGASTPFFVFTGASPVMFRRYSGGANITFDAATAALTYECLGGGNLTVALAGSDAQVRGTIRDMTITGMTSASLVEFVGTIGNLSLAGADGTVTLDGIVGAVVDSRTGSPTLNLPANTMGVVGNITGNLSGSVGSVTGAVGSVTGAVGSVTGHTAQTGDTYALANGATGFVAIDTVVDSILVDTAVIGAAGAGLTDLGGMSTTMKAQVNTEVDTAFTTQMADSVPADGTICTREQAIYLITQYLTERAYSGTTLTIYKVDGTTALATFTMDDATNPTTLTRAT